ncbi:D-alanine--D-alanine ligase [candidate division WWE3 bacterium]|nr:D-alanine--D-alanine ligase [candidate division WWE3 bacterium]
MKLSSKVQNKTKKRIAVLFGGKSAEHEVSIITGIQVINNIDKEKYDVLPIYVSKFSSWHTGKDLDKIETYRNLYSIPEKSNELLRGLESSSSNFSLVQKNKTFLAPFKYAPQENIDVIFPCFHGGLGENGGLQGMLELAEIPYVGSGILGSATGMDKIVMKDIFKQHNIPTANYFWFYRKDWEISPEKVISEIDMSLKYPLFVKPANAGSSIGISRVTNKVELQNGIEVAATFDRKIIVEEGFMHTKEINVSVMGNSGSTIKASVCEEVYAKSDFLNFEDKYIGSGKSSGMVSARRKIPADISKELEGRIRETAVKTFQILDCSGLARVDFLLDESTNEFIVVEINTTPGSMAFYLWEATGISFKELITQLIDLAYEKWEDTRKNITTFENNILEGFNTGAKSPKLN